MNEREFRDAYAKVQQGIHTTDELKRQTVAFAESHTREAGHVGRQQQPLRALTAKRWAIPAAACLAVAAIIAAGAPALVATINQGETPNIAMSDAAATSGFSVRAYASDGTSLFTMGNDGAVVFDRVEPLYGIGDDYAKEGFFTGCLFRIEGEGIARVQMNASSGKLYRYTIESFKQGDEPERMRELVGTKPLNRGLGTYYGGYDEVNVLPFRVGTDVRNNPDALVQVGLSKLYGATVDVSATDDPGIATGETSFGLWTNEGDPDELAAQKEPYAAVIDRFEGERLTVTVTFEDGHASTQVIELHAADFLRDEGNPEDPNDASLVPEIVDPAALGENQYALHSLYGTVVEASKEPFPLPLNDANEAKDTVLPAATLDRAPETTPLPSIDVVIHDANEAVFTTYRAPDEQDKSELTLTTGPLTVARGTTPPSGTTPDAFTEVTYGWLGDLRYFNKCTQERYGYAFNDDGTLTDEGFCYLEATLTVTNPGDEAVELDARNQGEFGMVDDAGQLSIIDTSYFTLDVRATGDVELDPENPRNVTVLPGGTARLSLLHVLPNRLADQEGLLFLVNFDLSGTPVAFAVGEQV